MEFSHIIQLFETEVKFVRDFSEVVILIDEKLIIKYWNSSAARIYGYSEQEAIGMSYQKLLLSHKAFEDMQQLIKQVDTDTEWRGRLIHKSKDGGLINFMSAIVTLKKGEQSEHLIVCIDMTEKNEFIDTLEELQGKSKKIVPFHEIEMTHCMERIHSGFCSFDRNWNYVHFNDKASVLFYKNANELIGKNVWLEFPDWVNTSFYKTYQDSFENNENKAIKAYSPTMNTWVEIHTYPTADHLCVFFKDMFEPRRIKIKGPVQELPNNNTHYPTEGIWIIEADNKTIFTNSFLCKKLGYTRDEIKGKHISYLISSEYMDIVLQNLEKRKKGISEQYDIKLKNKYDETIWVSLHSNPIFKDDKYVGSMAFVMNIDKRVENEFDLKKSRQELRELASKLQTIREEERATLAREIHDDLAQQLTALKMDIYWLANKLNNQDHVVKQKTDQMLGNVNKTLDQLRKKAIDLHPSLLDNLGLIAAIEWQNNEFHERFGIEIFFSCSDTDNKIPKDEALAFYRIYQEALNNIAKHSQATSVRSSFIHNEKGYYLTVTDNGKGFELNNIDQSKTLGLLSMKERSIAIGGQWSIRSTPGKGTTVSVFIELEVEQ